MINIEPFHEYLDRSLTKGATDVCFEPGESPTQRVDEALTSDEHPRVEQFELDALVAVAGGTDVLQRLKSTSSTESFTLHSPTIGHLRCAATAMPSVKNGFMVVVRLQDMGALKG